MDHRNGEPIEGLGLMVAAAVAFVVACWLLACGETLIYAGTMPRLSVFEAVSSALRLLGGGHGADPAGAYPQQARELMPAAAGWWAAFLAMTVSVGCVGTALFMRVEPAMARERLGRRPFDLRGARPRSWARPRDLHTGDESASVGFSVGRIDGRPVFTDEEAHIAVIAPTRAGKTTRCVVPWLDEHHGPAIVTSTKRDVLDLVGPRRRQGDVWVFDPFSDDSTSWTPIAGCESWSYALRQANWLADASAENDSAIARYWQGEAAKLLAPLLHAAALTEADMDLVLRWVDTQDRTAPMKCLLARGADAAGAQLEAVTGLDDRNRGTTYMSAGSVLAAYRYPEVMRCLGGELTAERFLESPEGTLFLVAAERHQALLAPLIVSIVSSLIHDATETGRFLAPDRRLRVLLDEAANIAPLHDLPRMLSQAAGHGIRIATIWQSLAQMRERHGHGADTILANSTAKLFMGAISDEPTRRYVDDLLGRDPEDVDHRKSRVTASALRQTELGRALLVQGAQLPAVVKLPSPTMQRAIPGQW